MTTMLLDTDMILYPAIAKATTEAEFDGEWIGPYVNLDVAKAHIASVIEELWPQVLQDLTSSARHDWAGSLEYFTNICL